MARRRPGRHQEALDEPVEEGPDTFVGLEQLHKGGLAAGREFHSASFHCLEVSSEAETAEDADEAGQPTLFRRSPGEGGVVNVDLTPGYRDAMPTATDEYPVASLPPEDGLDGMIAELLNEETDAGRCGFLPEAGFQITTRP